MSDTLNRDWEIFKSFAAHLTGSIDEQSKYISRDSAFYTLLRQEKLNSLGLTVKEDVKFLRGNDKYPGVSFDTPKYSGRRIFLRYNRKVEYFRQSKCIYSQKDKQILYQMIINAKDGIDPNESYCCPSCGAVSTISQLEQTGCPYCKGRFLMSELFPKVTDYFWLHDYSLSKRSWMIKLLSWLLVGTALGGVLGFFIMPSTNTAMDILNKLTAIAMCGFMGFIFGIVMSSISIMFRLVIDAIKVLPILARTSGSKNQIDRIVKQFDPYFPYELFESRVVALMKMMLYGSDLSDCAAFCGDKLPESNVVEAVYTGALALVDSQQQGDYLWLTVDVYADCSHCKKDKIKVSRDRLRMRVFKNVKAVTDVGFSIHKVQCDSCGASFDASRTKKCPYCKNDYRYYDHDWAAHSIERI